MNERIYTQEQLMKMPQNEYWFVNMCLRNRLYNLLGIKWDLWIEMERDPTTDTVIIRWE